MLFGLVSVMTALIAVLVLAIVWESPLTEYAMRNMQNAADATAEELAESYKENGGWTGDEHVASSFYGTDLVGVQAFDLDGNLIAQNEDAAEYVGATGEGAQEMSHSVNSTIEVDGQTVGYVVAWALGGADEALTESDIELRNSMYGAMILASTIAVVISCLIGYLVATGVVSPIRKITQTADEIKSGNLSARTNLVGTDEISQLGMTFDDMAQSIESDRELERRLTSDVAHELRTPLMAMQATIEAMADGVMPADAENLNMLDNEVIRLGKLVDAMLKLSRLENRSTPMNEQEIDLGEALEEVAFNHQMLMEESGLDFEYTYEPEIMVMADPDLIRQATANLLSNAVRYTPEGGSVTMEVRRQNVMAQIIVSDTGIGMKQEDLKHIFSRFWRADSGRERSSGGLGIGLAIVKEIVDRHNGWVHVDSVEGEGSTFTINIPLIKEDSKKQSKKKQDKQGTLQQRLLKFTSRSNADKVSDEDGEAKEASGSEDVGSGEKPREDSEKARRTRTRRSRSRGDRANGDGTVRYEVVNEQDIVDEGAEIGEQEDGSDSDHAE